MFSMISTDHHQKSAASPLNVSLPQGVRVLINLEVWKVCDVLGLFSHMLTWKHLKQSECPFLCVIILSFDANSLAPSHFGVILF